MSHATKSPTPPCPLEAQEVTAWIWRRDLWRIALVVLAALVVFANTLPNGFVYDDLLIVRDNPRLDRWWALGVFFGSDYWGGATAGSNLYRPLTIMSFAVDRAFFGPGPFGVHLTNVLGNTLVSALVYVFVLRLLGRRTVALVTALVFAIHPVHTEVVAGGVGRSEIHAAVMMLLAALLHLRFIRLARERPAGRDPGRAGGRTAALIAAAVCFFLALCFKESAVVLPGLLFLAEWLVIERGRLGSMRPGRYLVYVVPLAVYLVLRFRAVGAETPVVQEVMVGATTGQRMLFAGGVLLRSIGQLVLPLRLCAEYADYAAPVRDAARDPVTWAAVVVAVLIPLLVVALIRRKRLVLVLCIAWFALAILPVCNLVVPIGTIRGERLLYVPSLGYALAIGVLFASAARARPRLATAGLIVMLGLYAARSVVRNAEWSSQASLCEATVRDNPGAAMAWAMLGGIQRDRGETAAAIASFERCARLFDEIGLLHVDAQINHAQLLAETGDRTGAEVIYRRILGDRPEHYEAMINYGALVYGEGEGLDEAIGIFTRAARLAPDRYEAHANLAILLERAGRSEDAARAAAAARRAQGNQGRN